MATVLVLKDRRAKAKAHITVPSKGAKDPFGALRLRAALEEWGRAGVILRPGQEPSIIDLKRAVREMRRNETVEEQARRDDHQGNGEIEQAVGEMAGMVRTLRDGLRRRT